MKEKAEPRQLARTAKVSTPIKPERQNARTKTAKVLPKEPRTLTNRKVTPTKVSAPKVSALSDSEKLIEMLTLMSPCKVTINGSPILFICKTWNTHNKVECIDLRTHTMRERILILKELDAMEHHLK